MFGYINNNRTILFIALISFSILVLFDGIDIYRSIVFKSVPHDDYGSYLKFVASIGEAGGIPNSPWKERIGSVILSLPFLAVPPINFSGEMLVSPDMRHYYLALSLANAFYFYVAWLIIFHIAFSNKAENTDTTRNHLILFWSSLFVSHQVLSLQAMDGVGILLVAIALYIAQKRMMAALSVYAFAMLAFNEKVTVVIFGFLVADTIVNNGKWRYAFAALSALAAYFFYRLYVGGASEDTQTSINMIDKVSSFVASSLSPRGALLNLIPLMFCAIFIFYARTLYGRLVTGVILALLLASCIQAEVVYNVGRIVFYGVPFYFYFSLGLDGSRSGSTMLNLPASVARILPARSS